MYTCAWKTIGTYRVDPLPYKPVPPVPVPKYIPKLERRSILSYLPVVTEPVKEHVYNTKRWRS